MQIAQALLLKRYPSFQESKYFAGKSMMDSTPHKKPRTRRGFKSLELTDKEKEQLLSTFSGHRELNIKLLLLASNLTQADIARQFDIELTTVSKVIRGERATLHIRQKIARALNVPFHKLWTQ